MKFQLTPTPTSNDQIIVADSREKVADSREPKAYDLTELLGELVSTSDVSTSDVSTSKKSTSSYKGYTDARREANKRWAKDKAQISIKISADLKTQIDTHTSERGEKLAAFVVRAIKEQMERDSR